MTSENICDTYNIFNVHDIFTCMMNIMPVVYYDCYKCDIINFCDPYDICYVNTYNICDSYEVLMLVMITMSVMLIMSGI
jgi:hypothetical protein